jgi:hypothetical protein
VEICVLYDMNSNYRYSNYWSMANETFEAVLCVQEACITMVYRGRNIFASVVSTFVHWNRSKQHHRHGSPIHPEI